MVVYICTFSMILKKSGVVFHDNNILRNTQNVEFNLSSSVSSEETPILFIVWFILRQKCLTYNTNSDCVAVS
jgi:hypothetical protein